MGRLLAAGRGVTGDPVVSGLIEKRREVAGIIDQLQRQLDQHRADLTHIDGVLRILASDLDPESEPRKLRRQPPRSLGLRERRLRPFRDGLPDPLHRKGSLRRERMITFGRRRDREGHGEDKSRGRDGGTLSGTEGSNPFPSSRESGGQPDDLNATTRDP
jgi:hypothetical protein